jgi:hypothetical protein
MIADDEKEQVEGLLDTPDLAGALDPIGQSRVFFT